LLFVLSSSFFFFFFFVLFLRLIFIVPLTATTVAQRRLSYHAPNCLFAMDANAARAPQNRTVVHQEQIYKELRPKTHGRFVYFPGKVKLPVVLIPRAPLKRPCRRTKEKCTLLT
jgi:hypothetical protein